MFVLEGWFTQTTEIIFSHLYLVVSSHAHRFPAISIYPWYRLVCSTDTNKTNKTISVHYK